MITITVNETKSYDEHFNLFDNNDTIVMDVHCNICGDIICSDVLYGNDIEQSYELYCKEHVEKHRELHEKT